MMARMREPASLPFEKWQGAGNDFVLADALADGPWREVASDPGWLARQAIAACDRHFGVGADGLLLAVHDADGAIAMRMLNPDGTESEMCGNGLRCFGAWLHARGVLAPGAHPIVTGAGSLTVHVAPDGSVSVNMGRPRLLAPEIPVVGATGRADGTTTVALPGWDGKLLEATCVSMGNPHAVVFVTDVSSVPLEAVGPVLERHPAFPHRTNVEFCEVVGPDRLRVRVWERGAGATLACGTGACASLVAARLRAFVRPEVSIELPGGVLLATWHGGPHDVRHDVMLAGPTAMVFSGTWLALEA